MRIAFAPFFGPLRDCAKAVTCLALAGLAACGERAEVPLATRLSTLERVQSSGVLRVASIYGRTTCYTAPEGLVGYECELAQGIAKHVGATAEVIFSHTPADAVQAVLDGRADIAAAALTPNIAQRDLLRFSRAVDRAAPRLVFRMGNPRPKTPAELQGRLLVSEGAGHGATLQWLARTAPRLQAESTNAFDAEDLLFQVASGELDYTIASSALVAIHERYYPQIRTAFDIGDPEDVVLAFRDDPDRSLYDAATDYLASIDGKELARLHDRYYGHVDELDYFSAVQVANHMRTRLPGLEPMFKASAARHQLDWRLLAAIGYQESHWNPSATSYTGVRGIMMLTNDTAARYKVSNREDPAQSIEGGARVLADLLATIPLEVPEPDRTWMALAGYNQGLGHLLDARTLTTQRGGDALHWVDVRDTYPLLSRPRWAKAAKYGFARGREAVDFVSNVRAYYDLITMLSSGVRILPPPPLKLDSTLRTAARQLPESVEAPVVEDAAGIEEEPMPMPVAREPRNVLVIPAENEDRPPQGLTMELSIAPAPQRAAPLAASGAGDRLEGQTEGLSSN